MWIKYLINEFKYPIGFKVNIKTNVVVFGGPNKVLDVMYQILTDYFKQKDLVPVSTSPDKCKFIFKMKYQFVFATVRKLKKDVLVQKVDKLERIYR